MTTQQLCTAQNDLSQVLNDKDASKSDRDFLLFQASSVTRSLGHVDIADLIMAGKIQDAIDDLDVLIKSELRGGILPG